MPTSPELKEALKNTADKIAKYVEDVGTMTVHTRFMEMGTADDSSKLAARSVVKLDGDSETILAMKKAPDGSLVVDTVVNEMHQQNVQAAMDYRTGMLERFLSIFKSS